MKIYGWLKGRPLLVCIVIVLSVILVGLLYWDRGRRPSEGLKKLPHMPDKVVTEPAPPPYPPDAPLLVEVRKAFSKGLTPSEAVAMAKSLPEGPERPDAAFLLWEYAAEHNIAEAALMVAQYYDPLYKGSSGTIRKNPDMALQWYEQALAGGQGKAGGALVALRAWAEEQKKRGSAVKKQ